MNKIILLVFFLFSFSIAQAQNVAINANGSTPNSSSILDLNTGNTFTSPNGKGLLIPNVSLTSTTDNVTIASPATSLLIYNTNAAMTGGWKGYWYWDGTKWNALLDNVAPGAGWTVNGNTGITTPAVPTSYGTSTITATENWLGTTDARDLVLGTNNIERMRIDNATGNIAIGSASPNANRTLYALYAGTAATGAAVWGSATGAAKVFGVFGSISSITTDAAGVRGFSGGASGATAAVQGENQSADGFGVYGINTYGAGAGTNMYGVYGIKSGNAGTGTGFGIYGTATGTAATNIGGYFLASGGTNNIALRMRGSTSGNLDISPSAVTTSHSLIMPAAQGAANTVLTNDGAGNLSWAVPSGGGGTIFTGFQVFTSSGTWTQPAGVTKVMVEVWAGGGGGGGSSFNGCNGGYAGNGGGAGAFFKGLVTVSSNITVTVGAAGTAGAPSATGGTGGSSSLVGTGVNVICTGGTGGAIFTGAPGSGGTVTSTTGAVAGCTWSVSGYPGIYSNGGGTGGLGGNAPQGGTGGGNGYAPGKAGNVPGGGGAGCESDCVSNKAGGAGAAGTVIIWW